MVSTHRNDNCLLINRYSVASFKEAVCMVSAVFQLLVHAQRLELVISDVSERGSAIS